MGSSSGKLFSVTLILAIAIPISTSRIAIWDEPPKDTQQNLRNLCSKTNRSKDCRKILKPYRVANSDDKTIAGTVIDLAIAKSDEIHDQLNQYYSDSKNAELKEKYIACSKNYNDINRNLVVARRGLDSKDGRNIGVEIGDAGEELKYCREVFEKKSFDPAHVRDRNKEIELYLEIVQVAAMSLEKLHY